MPLQNKTFIILKKLSKKFCFVRRVGQMGQVGRGENFELGTNCKLVPAGGETPHHVAQTEKGGVCVAVYSIKGLTKLTKDVPYSTWHVFCYIT
jgi:hypothetical protein